MDDLPNKIRDGLGLMPHVNLFEEGEKAFLEIVVEPSTVPISLRGAYYSRSGSTMQQLKGNYLTDFLLKKMGMTWDRVVESKACLEDIDYNAIETFKKDAAKAGRLPNLEDLSSKEILKKLRFLSKEGLTRAALVLFGKDPGEFYPNLFVKLGRFGLTDVDIRFQEVCEGNLIFMLKDVIEILEHKFLRKKISFEGIQRIETLEFPKPALREMLLNALVHRNYLGSMTQLKVYDDRLSLWNAGALPEELTVDALFKNHESIPRNPLIAEICYKAGYIDSWGRGIEKISSACKEAELPKPVIFERSGGVVVELKKELDVYVNEPGLNYITTEVTMEVTTEVTTEVKRLLLVCNGEKSRKELQDLAGLKNDEYFRKAYIAPAIESGVLMMTVPDKPNSRFQKYCLTDKGRIIRKNL